MPIKGRRVESPSSINTFRQCPRKYYYQYIEKLPTGTSIHLIRGSVVHSALEDFFDADLADEVAQSFKFLHLRILSLFTRHWKKNQPQLQKLELSVEELQAFFDESIMMLQNWFDRFKAKMLKRIDRGESFAEAFRALTPRREVEYKSEEYMVKGYIDVVHEIDGQTVVLDYKTSKKDEITDEYRLQLAIYAMLYEEKHGFRPSFVGIDFLKSIEKIIPVDEDLIKHAQFEIEQVHASTGSNHIGEYPQRPSPLCKWKTGQCDFYDVCFGGMSNVAFRAKYGKK